VLNPGDLVGRTHRNEPAGLRLGIPVYADPDTHPELWAGVARAPAGSVVIINPDSGAGQIRDARYAERVARAHAQGQVVYGYVDTAYGGRRVELVVAEIERHRDWFGVDGIFFDQVPGAGFHLAHYRRLADLARTHGLDVAFNMGQANVDPRYAELADVLVVFEGPGAAHAAARFPDWMRDSARRAQLWHLVFDVSDDDAMRAALARAAAGPCEVVFVTDGSGPNPWSRLPSYWEHELALVASSRRAGVQ